LIKFIVELIDNESRVVHPLALGNGELDKR